MTGTVLLVTVYTFLAVGVTIAAIAWVTMGIRREEHRHTLTGPAQDWTTHTVRRLNGVYVRMLDGTTYSRHNELPGRRASARVRSLPQERPVEASSDFPAAR